MTSSVHQWRRPVRAPSRDVSIAGYFRIIARPSLGAPVELTTFRGSPVTINSFSFTDPFGPEEMQILLPQVSILEKTGVGDLSFVRREVDVDVFWVGPLPAKWAVVPGARLPAGIVIDTPPPGYVSSHLQYPVKQLWRWSGYIDDLGRGNDGLTLQLKGAMHQLDGWLAKPEYPARPLLYEWAIAHAFGSKPASRLAPLQIVWPPWWTYRYVPPASSNSYLTPSGPSPGAFTTGLLTRATGSWDPTLTGYVQSLLTSMYTERGRWTLDLNGRTPVLFHRDKIDIGSDALLVLDPVNPGVKIDLHEDGSQVVTTIYGQGTGLNGVAYSGMNVSSDGMETMYSPLAALRQVYPTQSDNQWYDVQRMPKEVYLQLQQGIAEDDAMIVARNHLRTFAEPGFTGTVTLQSDPVDADGNPVLKHLVRAGMSLRVPGFNGDQRGVVLHVSRSEHDIAKDTTTLTVDSKFRDALTVEEVRLRGRDSLQVSRMLIAGSYTPPVPDQMMPWDYSAGSGFIPSNSSFSSVPLFAGMPSTVRFPWQEWTMQRPPSSARWRSSYLHVYPAKPIADQNWFVQHSAAGSAMGVPIRMAQAGTIRLLQVAAYDSSGRVMPIPFHISFYYVGGVNVLSMPQIAASDTQKYPPFLAAQHYPFAKDGFESYRIDGTKVNPTVPQPIESVGLLRAYGTYYEKAGYFPGSYATGDRPTGLLVDESTWSFDVTGVGEAYWDPYSVANTLKMPLSGQVFAMIYADGQEDRDVFFLGRMFRSEPGTGGS